MLSRIVVLLGLLAVSACAQYENKRGVDVNWQSTVTDQLVRGVSSRQDTLALLGPPSQVIALEEGTVLYYLFERARGKGLVLLVYNQFEVDTRYDRAIFFFDEKETLTDYATHVYPQDNE